MAGVKRCAPPAEAGWPQVRVKNAGRLPAFLRPAPAAAPGAPLEAPGVLFVVVFVFPVEDPPCLVSHPSPLPSLLDLRAMQLKAFAASSGRVAVASRGRRTTVRVQVRRQGAREQRKIPAARWPGRRRPARGS